MSRITPQDVILPNGIVVPDERPVTVTVKKARGPALADTPVTYHPDFKFTKCPSPQLGLRTNTHPK